jgi:hypothetical protein
LFGGERVVPTHQILAAPPPIQYDKTKIERVCGRYHVRTGGAAPPTVNFAALQHADCSCSIPIDLDIRGIGLPWNAAGNVESPDSTAECGNFVNCGRPCNSVTQYTYLAHEGFLRNSLCDIHDNENKNRYGFLAIMLEREGMRYEYYENAFKTMPAVQLIWYLKLMGEYREEEDRTYAYPWMNYLKSEYSGKRLMEKYSDLFRQFIIMENMDANDRVKCSITDRALAALDNHRGHNWFLLKKMYLYVLRVLEKKEYGYRQNELTREQREVFLYAKREYIALTGDNNLLPNFLDAQYRAHNII